MGQGGAELTNSVVAIYKCGLEIMISSYSQNIKSEVV
jgi:hypothetical protein